MFNPKTKKIILTRDVTFLWKSYGESTKVDKPVVVTTSHEGSVEEEELKTVPAVINYNETELVILTQIPMKKTSKMMTKMFLMKTSTTKLKLPPKSLSMQKWYKP